MKRPQLSHKHIVALRWLLRQAHLHHRCEVQEHSYESLAKYYGVHMTRALDTIRIIEDIVHAKETRNHGGNTRD